MSLLHKNLAVLDLNLKFSEEKRGFFSGYASKFNGVDSYGDTIVPGAYKSTLESRDRPVELRWNHYGEIIGKWTAIQEDSHGLYVEGELTPGHSKAEDVYALMKHGAITGMSIGYRIKDAVKKSEIVSDFSSEAEKAAARKGGRILKEIDLVEISIVESPADIGAQVADVKAAVDNATSLKDLENLLREAGRFSKTDATAIIAKASALKGRGEPVPAQDGEEAARIALAFAFQRIIK